MKIVIIGGTGLIGSQLTNRLREKGHDVIAASPASGVNTITGEGLKEVLFNTDVVVDVSNSPSFEDQAVMEFFMTSGKNLLREEEIAGVKHHVALSIVGNDRVPESGYLRAKTEQEKLIRESGMPYSILRSTQFYEFAASIARSGLIEEEIRISTGLIQPIASDEVVAALTDIVVGDPLNGFIEVAGPQRFRMDEFIRLYLKSVNDKRPLIGDPQARYFGAEITNQIVPIGHARIGAQRYEDWLTSHTYSI